MNSKHKFFLSVSQTEYVLKVWGSFVCFLLIEVLHWTKYWSQLVFETDTLMINYGDVSVLNVEI